jgi:hypothetical protein
MAKMTYTEQLKHPNWQRRRLEILELSDFSCTCCGDKEKMLHVHHRRYIKGRMAWEYGDNELTALCETCHKDHHDARDLLERILAEAEESSGGSLLTAIGLLAGYFSGAVSIGPELEQEAIALDGHSHDLGLMAGLASGASWEKMAQAADILRPRTLSPAESQAISRWKGE